MFVQFGVKIVNDFPGESIYIVVIVTVFGCAVDEYLAELFTGKSFFIASISSVIEILFSSNTNFLMAARESVVLPIPRVKICP